MTEVFEYDKANFKSERLRRLCTFRPIPKEATDVEDIKQRQRQLLESEDGLFDNYTSVLKVF